MQSLLKSQSSAQTEASLRTQAAINADREHAIAEATERLKLFAKSLAANVDAHQSEVQAVSNSLHECTEDISNEALCIAVNRLIEANETMQRELQSSQVHIQDQASRLETAERHAQTDALTRVCNRRAFDLHLASRVALGHGQAGTLMLLDIDNFKRFNDTYGHRTGDEVLRIVAEVLNSRLNEYGMVARYGGEEFAVILNGYSVRDSIPIIEAAREAIGSREVLFENKRLHVTASIGLAELGANESSSDWVQHADDCLYLSKNNGRNCGHWSDAGEYFPITSGKCAVENMTSVSVPVPTQAKAQATLKTQARSSETASIGTTPSQPTPSKVQAPNVASNLETVATIVESAASTNASIKTSEAIASSESTAIDQETESPETKPQNIESQEIESQVVALQESVSTTPEPRANEKPVSTATQGETPALPNPFPYLPDRHTLAGSARELGEHLRSTRMPMSIMAIQISERLKGPSSRSLLQIVRAASRTIDQIGCDGPTTLLICMPNTNEASSLDRAEQIVRSAASLNLGVKAAESTNLIGVGVMQWDGSDEFLSAFDLVQELAKSAANDKANPVRVAALVERE